MVISQVFISILSFFIKDCIEQVHLRAVREHNCYSSSTLRLLFLEYKSSDDITKM